MSVLLVTSTVMVRLLARSFSVILPPAESTLISSPERSWNDPLTTSAACTVNPSADFVPRACNWSFTCTCANAPGFAFSYFTESPAKRLNAVLLDVTTAIFFVPEVSVIVPLAGSMALTMPPTPFVFQSACWSACILAMSADFISTTCRALKLSAASPALTEARMRSPTAMSENWLGVAVFKSTLPTASTETFTPSGTVMVTVPPASVTTVRALPLIAFTVPRCGGVAGAAAGA